MIDNAVVDAIDNIDAIDRFIATLPRPKLFSSFLPKSPRIVILRIDVNDVTEIGEDTRLVFTDYHNEDKYRSYVIDRYRLEKESENEEISKLIYNERWITSENNFNKIKSAYGRDGYVRYADIINLDGVQFVDKNEYHLTKNEKNFWNNVEKFKDTSRMYDFLPEEIALDYEPKYLFYYNGHIDGYDLCKAIWYNEEETGISIRLYLNRMGVAFPIPEFSMYVIKPLADSDCLGCRYFAKDSKDLEKVLRGNCLPDSFDDETINSIISCAESDDHWKITDIRVVDYSGSKDMTIGQRIMYSRQHWNIR